MQRDTEVCPRSIRIITEVSTKVRTISGYRCRESTIHAAPKWHKRYHKTCHKKPVFLGRGYLIP